jgi:hypothetical protein
MGDFLTSLEITEPYKEYNASPNIHEWSYVTKWKKWAWKCDIFWHPKLESGNNLYQFIWKIISNIYICNPNWLWKVSCSSALPAFRWSFVSSRALPRQPQDGGQS